MINSNSVDLTRLHDAIIDLCYTKMNWGVTYYVDGIDPMRISRIKILDELKSDEDYKLLASRILSDFTGKSYSSILYINFLHDCGDLILMRYGFAK